MIFCFVEDKMFYKDGSFLQIVTIYQSGKLIKGGLYKVKTRTL